MKNKILISLLIISFLFLTACSKKEAKENSGVESKKISSRKQKEPLGDRSNPAKLNQPVRYSLNYKDELNVAQDGNFTLEITKYVRGEEAMKYLEDANDHNQAAPKDMEWLLLDVSISLTAKNNETAYFYMPTFTILDATGYPLAQDIEAILKPEDTFGFTNLVPKEKSTGKIAKLVPTDHLISLEYKDGNQKIFFTFE